MREDFEEDYHRLEEDHWWFIGRRAIILSLIKDAILA
ncbi:MAG: class I SAM-dependent methyltransferase, partial [Deltaproteobacteria bacterium]